MQSKLLLELPNLRCIKREGAVSVVITYECPFDRASLSEREGGGRRGEGGEKAGHKNKLVCRNGSI
jgi:hypothetical protein